jgi:hypothetical protein
MSENRETRVDFSVIFWGSLLLFFGVVLLLNVTETVTWRVWGELWKFWPVLIILFGLSFIIPRRRFWLMLVLTLGIPGACLGIAVAQSAPGYGPPQFIQQEDTFPIGRVERVEADIVFSGGALLIADYTEDPAILVKVQDGRERNVADRARSMAVEFGEKDGLAVLDVEPVNLDLWDRWRVHWAILFNPGKLTYLDLSCNGSRVTLSLEDLQVKDLRLDMNACTGWLTLPASAGTATIDIDMNVSNLEINVPTGVAVKIQADVNIGILNIDESRYPRQGDYYISPDYETSAIRVELYILADLSRVSIK